MHSAQYGGASLMMAIKVEQNNAIELSGMYNTTITQDSDNKVLPQMLLYQ
jgi:hypothetical protein